MLSRQLTIVVLCFLTQAVISRVVPLPEGFRLKPSQNSTCPCADPSLCKPVQKIHAKEIFGFGGTDWQNFDWDVVTTIAWASDPELVCHAHAKNTRIIAGAPHDMPLTSNKTARAEYIQAAIDMVRDQHLDGITFDYESPINKTAPERDYYTQIVSEATAAFHEQLPGTQVSVCVGWSPNDIDGRDYDYVGLAKGSDLFYVMVYDTRSQIFDRCIASANAPAARANRGLFGYLDLGIPPQQLIMGLPWYGYDYKCPDPSMSPASPYCAIPEIPFRGVNCSDAAGKEYSFAHFREIMSSPNATTPRLWDNSVESPFFNYRSSDGSIHQVWYDDAESLSIKYRLAKAMNLRGVGPYTFTDLDYSTPESTQARKDAASMWQALRAFLD